MMQQAGMAETIKKKFPFVDIIIGTHNLHNFSNYLNEVKKKHTSVLKIQEKEDSIIENMPIDRKIV